MRALLTATGTRGDLQPLFALARALTKAGHDAIVAGPPNFAPEAAALGVTYHSCGPDMQRLITAHSQLGANPISLIRAARERAYIDFIEYFDALLPLARRSDVVVGAGLMFAAASVSEAANIPYRYLAYATDVLPSMYHAPPIANVPGLPRPVNRWLWSGFAKLIDWMIKPALNDRRRAHGLPPARSVLPTLTEPARALLAADPELSPLPPDLTLAAAPLGALRLDDERPLPDVLQHFLDAGNAPIYVGFGSMPDANPAATTRTIVAAAKAVGARLVLARGWAELGQDLAGDDSVLVIGEVAHRALFPRVAAVVHHGGAGTSDAATLSGVPQVLVPHLLDQFGWARRLHRLGVCPKPVPKHFLTQRRLERALRAVLHASDCQTRARTLAAVIAKRDGRLAAIQALEAALPAPVRDRPPARPEGPRSRRSVAPAPV